MKWRTLADGALRDARYALRTARRNPGFAAVAILSLALGIGANGAIFTFVDAALLKPLPYRAADRIVALLQRPLNGQDATYVHPRSFVEWHDRAQSFEALAIAQPIPVNTSSEDGAEQVPGLWTTAAMFRVFGVVPFLGRTFTEEEGFGKAAVRGDPAGERSVAILSHGYWQRPGIGSGDRRHPRRLHGGNVERRRLPSSPAEPQRAGGGWVALVPVLWPSARRRGRLHRPGGTGGHRRSCGPTACERKGVGRSRPRPARLSRARPSSHPARAGKPGRARSAHRVRQSGRSPPGPRRAAR